MKHCDFKKHSVICSAPPAKSPYSRYKEDLERDFCNRCAYCNLHKASITTPFEVDHFIPKEVFSHVRDDLLEDYNNLIYSCKKCNIAKSSKFEGDIHSANPTNARFYNPRVVDFNTIFYRNEYGAIVSDDLKGKGMIVDLKLYRPIHIVGWMCEELDSMGRRLDKMIEDEACSERRNVLVDAKNRVANKYMECIRVFLASYNDNSFDLDGIEHLQRY